MMYMGGPDMAPKPPTLGNQISAKKRAGAPSAPAIL